MTKSYVRWRFETIFVENSVSHVNFHEQNEAHLCDPFFFHKCLRCFKKIFWKKRCSTSPPGGNQVDGLPPALSVILGVLRWNLRYFPKIVLLLSIFPESSINRRRLSQKLSVRASLLSSFKSARRSNFERQKWWKNRKFWNFLKWSKNNRRC